MTENDTKNWEEARARLVEQRQSIVKALAKSRRIKSDIDLLIQIQAGIDALDKAKHEIFRLSIDPIGRRRKLRDMPLHMMGMRISPRGGQ